MVNVRVARPVLPSASACVTSIVYVPSASELIETYQKPATREAERVRIGVPLALEPLKRLKDTVALSPSSVPAAP
jgi:hypothetical protein